MPLGANTTVANSLVVPDYLIDEGSTLEYAIVGVVGVNNNSHVQKGALEVLLSSDRVSSIESDLTFDVKVARGSIAEH